MNYVLFLFARLIISSFQALTTLNLSENQIGNNGICHLSQALRQNTVRSYALVVMILVFDLIGIDLSQFER